MIQRNLFALALLALAYLPQLEAVELQLNKGDHICYIGNTLADRMQHDGWLETLIQTRFPTHELVFRNLGFSGDELTTRLRSSDFGSPDSWLTKEQADVIFAFFGYNESHAGAAGLDKFKQDLTDQIKQMQAQKYNGESAPRIVIFSPIAHEDLDDPNLPDGSENNKRLELYTAAMAEVAQANGAAFVDIFHSTKEFYGQSDKSLTINGVHLNEFGNRSLATIIDEALFGADANVIRANGRVAAVRQAVLDKNFHWYERYRTTDGYSIYGGRADLKFTDGQTNREVAQREMEILDVMTANRDKRIWAAAQGKELQVDDSNTPDFIPVISNKQGPGPNGTFEFLSGESAIGNMEVAKGMKINLFADEAMFPEMVNPVQMAFDAQGRLWVAAWESYPHWKPKDKMDDKLLILEDTNGDGRADVCKTFAGGLHNPTGFEFWGGGVLVATAPEIYFLKDTDGDEVADVRTRVVSGIDSADTHHGSNSFVFDPGGGVYFQEGTFHQSQVETPWGPVRRCSNAGVFRYEPRTQKFDVYVTHGFANPHGHVFDAWGRDIIHDGTGAVPYDGALFSGHLEYPAKHARPPMVYQQRTRPCGGTEILSSGHCPDENQGNLLVPIDIEIAPDGSLYFTDWQNPIIGHMQHNLRDPNRDRMHGRVYRVTYPSRPLLTPPKIAGESIEHLLELLKDKNNRVRYRAKIELSARDSGQVIAATKKWLASLDKADADYEHHMMEALWVHQHHNVVDQALLERMLQSPEPRARTAATRVLCHWRDSIPNTLALLNGLAADEYPRVRLEAVRAASFLTVPEAVEVPLIAAEEPTDIYLDYVRDETMKALDRYWKEAVASGARVPFTSQAGARFFLKNLSNDQLLKEERNRTVYLEMLYRPGLRD
ncbi:MAG: dehydrogenase, partial [Planctomycetia bacterium]|nr:dehydrogenase [Planctomycetia bacterium]